MWNWRRQIAVSNHWLARGARGARRGIQHFSLPAPAILVLPLAKTIVAARETYWFFKRVLVCEPFFKAYCTRYGRNVRVGTYLHYIKGRGSIIIGDDVLIDGKCSFSFATRFADRPLLEIGDHTGIGHNCTFSVGKRIAIGRYCRIASDTWIFDSPGHPAEPSLRQAGAPPADEEVKPVTIEDSVWLGRRCIIFPGVTVGKGSIVAAGAVVIQDVPPLTVVAGNPARQIASLRPARQVNPIPSPAATRVEGEQQAALANALPSST